uniref:Putative zinc finger CCCH domain-containing protein 39-like isoform X1 n=1 Tax=Davidia involucrata TaxID=16924 RepID=A0A5B7BDX1_DAVIN
MSVPAHTRQFCGPPDEYGGDAFKFRPQLPIYEQQSEVLSNVEYPAFKKPRNSETILNPRMPSIPFKTHACAKFRMGNCSFGDNCHFTHGIGDIRKLPTNKQGLGADEGRLVWNSDEDHRLISKLKLCRRFCNGEKCPFGERCHFIHEGLTKIREDLGLSRKSFAISIGTAGSGLDCRSGSEQLECKRFVNSSLNINRVYQKPVFWKTRPCNKWERTGNCPYGKTCYFAHGQAELQKLGTHTALESGNVSTSEARAAHAKDASPSRTRIMTSYKQQLQGKKCLFKWKGIEKISRIYADWIDDMPLVHSSLGKVGS